MNFKCLIGVKLFRDKDEIMQDFEIIGKTGKMIRLVRVMRILRFYENVIL